MKDGVADKLPGTVIGDVTTSFNLIDFYAPASKFLFGDEKVFFVCPAANGDDRRVFEE